MINFQPTFNLVENPLYIMLLILGWLVSKSLEGCKISVHLSFNILFLLLIVRYLCFIFFKILCTPCLCLRVGQEVWKPFNLIMVCLHFCIVFHIRKKTTNKLGFLLESGTMEGTFLVVVIIYLVAISTLAAVSRSASLPRKLYNVLLS